MGGEEVATFEVEADALFFAAMPEIMELLEEVSRDGATPNQYRRVMDRIRGVR